VQYFVLRENQIARQFGRIKYSGQVKVLILPPRCSYSSNKGNEESIKSRLSIHWLSQGLVLRQS
jgi:hypothetical protein